MLLSKAIEGFFMFIRADGYADNTVRLYGYMLDPFLKYLGDRELDDISQEDLLEFFVYLREVYHKEKGHPDKTLSGSTMQNFWKAIRTFFEWAEAQKLISVRPDTELKLPRNNPKIIMPLSEDEVRALIKSAEYTREVHIGSRAGFKMKRSSALRDTALLILLLDTGIRAGEAGRLDLGDVNLEKAEIYIRPFGNSRHKTESRTIPLGKVCQRILWKHITTLDDASVDDPVFLTMQGRRMDRAVILQLVRNLGEKAGVKNCHPHRLRHTFAVEYLRNGGDIFTLKAILGHSSLDMVQHYLQLSQSDTTNAHRRASPADKWRL